jgi:hypothetical protein
MSRPEEISYTFRSHLQKFGVRIYIIRNGNNTDTHLLENAEAAIYTM